jgi:hypothetical protein
MNVTFRCVHCEQIGQVAIAPGQERFDCPRCGAEFLEPKGALEGGRLRRCLVCPSTDLYARKDFPQRLGVLIVTIGFAASCVTWAYERPIATFAILFATALVDVVLYLFMPNTVMCYRCGAQYRGLDDADEYEGFHLETHERHRQQNLRLAEHRRKNQATKESAQAGPETIGRL